MVPHRSCHKATNFHLVVPNCKLLLLVLSSLPTTQQVLSKCLLTVREVVSSSDQCPQSVSWPLTRPFLGVEVGSAGHRPQVSSPLGRKGLVADGSPAPVRQSSSSHPLGLAPLALAATAPQNQGETAPNMRSKCTLHFSPGSFLPGN